MKTSKRVIVLLFCGLTIPEIVSYLSALFIKKHEHNFSDFDDIISLSVA